MDKVIITAAAVGAEADKRDRPGLPTTPDELARDARRCRDAGAAIYHLHVRDAKGAPTMSVDAFSAAKSAIEEATDLIVQFTTGGAVSDSEDDRIAPLALRPEMATLTTGSVNFGDDVFLNRAPFVERLYRKILDAGTVPEYEIFDSGMVAAALRLYESLGASHHRHFDFVLGVPGAMPAWDDALSYLVSKIPHDATWSATGIGRAHLDVTRTALDLGGNVRTGLEDVAFYDAGVPVTENAQLIERVARMAAEAGRETASPQEARDGLGLSSST